MDTLYSLLAIEIAGVCTILVWHDEYEDGVFGRFALGVLALAELCVAWASWVDKSDYNGLLGTTYAIQVGIALFITRHLYRFLRNRITGEYDWRPAKK